MLNGEYVKHDICLAMDILIAGLTSENERLLGRAALYVLSSLYRNITQQMNTITQFEPGDEEPEELSAKAA